MKIVLAIIALFLLCQVALAGDSITCGAAENDCITECCRACGGSLSTSGGILVCKGSLQCNCAHCHEQYKACMEEGTGWPCTIEVFILLGGAGAALYLGNYKK